MREGSSDEAQRQGSMSTAATKDHQEVNQQYGEHPSHPGLGEGYDGRHDQAYAATDTDRTKTLIPEQYEDAVGSSAYGAAEPSSGYEEPAYAVTAWEDQHASNAGQTSGVPTGLPSTLLGVNPEYHDWSFRGHPIPSSEQEENNGHQYVTRTTTEGGDDDIAGGEHPQYGSNQWLPAPRSQNQHGPLSPLEVVSDLIGFNVRNEFEEQLEYLLELRQQFIEDAGEAEEQEV
jgi:hypothetical protein